MIAPHIEAELAAAGLLGLPFAWGADGVVEYGPTLTAAQRTAIAAVFAAHDPTDAAKAEAYIDAQIDAGNADLVRWIKAVALWQANLHGIAPATARLQIRTVYKALGATSS